MSNENLLWVDGEGKMTFEEAMAELEAAGTAQNRKIYGRHGAREPMFGVSFAKLKELTKKIKKDHELAMKLWASGNMDARTLALMVIDAAQVSSQEADNMLKSIRYYMLIDALVSSVIIFHDDAKSKLGRWTRAKSENLKRAGYSLVCQFARMEDSLPDRQFRNYIERIEKEIHESPNRAKQIMNIALLNIGLRNDALFEDALAAAKRIGKVEVDHGDTSCKTYDTAAMLSDETYVARARASTAKRHKPKKKKK